LLRCCIDAASRQARIVQVQQFAYDGTIHTATQKGTAMSKTTFDETQVRETAYLFWLDDGQPQGRDQEHWLRAIDALSTPAAKAKPAGKATRKPRSAGTTAKQAASALAKKTTKPKAAPKAKSKAKSNAVAK
jgi:hypothetical protein